MSHCKRILKANCSTHTLLEMGGQRKGGETERKREGEYSEGERTDNGLKSLGINFWQLMAA